MANIIIDEQNQLFGRIARSVENFRKLGVDNQTKSAIEARLERLNQNWDKFEDNDAKLRATKLTDDVRKDVYFKDDLFSKAEEEYLQAKSLFAGLLSEFETPTSSSGSRRSSFGPARSKPLPKINLPKFNGNYSEWVSFRDLFTSLVGSNNEISSVEKLQYLKMSVGGDAAKLIASIPVTEDNYDRTWKKLEARYQNKRALVNAQLDIFFSLRPIQKKSARELENLRATVSQVLEALEALGGPVGEWDFILVYFLCRLLDADTHEAWEFHLGRQTEPPTYEELDKFLEGRIRGLETLNGRPSGSTIQSSSPSSRPSQRSATRMSQAFTSSATSCSCCGATHYIASCSVYRAKTPQQRREFVLSKRLCFNCLGPHMVSACRTSKCCHTCNERHHSSLHQSSSSSSVVAQPTASAQVNSTTMTSVRSQHSHATSSTSQGPTASPAQPVQPSNLNGSSTVHHASIMSPPSSASQSLLATALITVSSPEGFSIKARALLDQGSELSFVGESIVQTLHLPRRQSSIALYGIGAQRQTVTRGSVLLRFGSHLDSSQEFCTEAHVLRRVTGCIPAGPVDVNSCAHLQGLNLADPSFAVPGCVDIVLGANIYGQLLKEEIRKSDSSSPVAQLTHLGWIVSGPVLIARSPRSEERRIHICSVDQDLHELVHRFWAQEEVPSLKTIPSEEDAACEAHFVATHSRRDDGRYVVRLPFKKKPVFGDSRSAASRMLKNMQSRFQRDSAFQELYTSFLEEYLALGHMEPATNEAEGTSFYLPHHGVLRASSTTTKLRVVFNGSQKTASGVSLNDCLHAGPKIQTDLVDIISRWRFYAFAFTADIEKMYRQVLVHPEDRDFQRILWSSNQGQTPVSHRLSTVTYGLTCSPYLAIRTLHQLAKDEGLRFPSAVDIVLKNSYVDDVLSGGDTEAEAKEKVRQIDLLLSAGGFRLQKWASNYDEVLSPIESSRHQNVSKTFEEGPILKALGISWNPVSDAFAMTVHHENLANTSVLTKRSILSMVAKLFDPLGWVAPVVIVAKMFLQSLWRTSLLWDDELPEDLTKEWSSFACHLQSPVTFSLPRWMGTSSASVLELHGFSDASQKALGAVVYVRVVTETFEATTSLLMAKSKVSPLKQVTIARLELSAAVMLAQLVQSCQKALDLQTVPVYLWTDSAVALTWISGHPSRWKEFVGNRVSFIHETVPLARWRHVPGHQNPADAASRGLSPQQLQHCTLWWKGPEWLASPSTSWPVSLPHLPVEVNLEERSSVVHAVTAQPAVWDLIDKYSVLNTLLRVTARLFRAVQVFRRAVNREESSSVLRPEELERAMLFWVRLVQEAYFAEEIQILRRKEELPRSNRLVRLTPFVDEEGYLRVGGRLRNSDLEYDAKHPFLIPRQSAFTTLLVKDSHLRTLHGGVQLTLSRVRQKFRILGGRAPIRSFILKCVTCARYRGTLASQMMGQLPSLRTTPSRPFLHAGVDYAGPFIVKKWQDRSARCSKAYLIIFVCFATSAVHLELSGDYITDGFLAAYRRFAGRRGLCASITSDCGTNFVGADRELKRLFSATSREFASLRDTLAADRTSWHFNPPGAPHFGGKWEAGVKSVKHHIRRVVGEARLTYEEFLSLLCQIEGTLNSRPLCSLSDDPNDVEALTPGHFLTGGPINSVPEPSLFHLQENRLSRWQRTQKMLQHFWARWSAEYLQRMQAISKWTHSEQQLQVGRLVLVSDERSPPAKWPLARITKVHPGRDGHVRVVTLKTAPGSEFQRPIVKLCPLPVGSEEM